MAYPAHTVLQPPVLLPAHPRRPIAVTVIQAVVFVPALAAPALILLMLQHLVGYIAFQRQWGLLGPDAAESESTPMGLATSEFLPEFIVALGLPVVLALLAVISTIGLHKRRRWARIFTTIRSSVLLLPWAGWAVGCQILVLTVPKPTPEDYYIGPIDPLMLNAIAGTAAFIAELLVFILVLTRGTRRWTPKIPSTPMHKGTWSPVPPQYPTYSTRG